MPHVGGGSIRAALNIHAHDAHNRAEAAAREEEARAWEAELGRSAETPEQRRARLHAHALTLKEKKCVRWLLCVGGVSPCRVPLVAAVDDAITPSLHTQNAARPRGRLSCRSAMTGSGGACVCAGAASESISF